MLFGFAVLSFLSAPVLGNPLVLQERTRPALGVGGGAGGKFGGRFGKRKPNRLRRGDPGFAVAGVLVPEWEGDWESRPKVLIEVEAVEGEEWVAYGPDRVGRSGRFSVRIPLEAKRGRVKLDGYGYRFEGGTEFTVEEGKAHFAEELIVQRGPVIEVEFADSDGVLKQKARSKLIRSRGRPYLRPARIYSWDLLDSRLGLSGSVKHKPIEPLEHLWAVIDSPGYATVQVKVEQDRLEWGSSIVERVVLEPEVPLTLRVLRPDGELAEAAHLRVNHSPVLESSLYWVATEPQNPAVMEGLGADTYYASISGHGYLLSQYVIKLRQGFHRHMPMDLQLNPGLGVSPTLEWGDGSPVVGATVWARPDPEDGEIPRVESEPYPFMDLPPFGPRWSGETDESGKVVLSGFQRAKSFAILVKAEPSESDIPQGLSKIKRRRFVRENTVWANFDGWSPQLEPSKIVLSNVSKGIQGRVVNDLGESVARLTVAAYADCDGPALEASLLGGKLDSSILGESLSGRFSSADGKFTLGRLQAGSWSLLVSSRGHASKVVRSVEPSHDPIEVVLSRLDKGPEEGAHVELASLAGTLDPRLRGQNMRVRVTAANSENTASAARVVPVDENGWFLVEGLLPGTYRVEGVFTENLHPENPLGIGHVVETTVSGEQENKVDYGLGGDVVELKGKMDEEGEPFEGWLYFEDLEAGSMIAAPVDKSGKYQAWTVGGRRYNVYVCKRPQGLSGDDHVWVASDWTAPKESTQSDWSFPEGRVRLRLVDQAGEPIQWATHDKGLTAYWYADHDRQAYGWEGTIPPNGVLKGLLPGGSYRIHLEGANLRGDLMEARDVLFQVPMDESLPVIDIPCVGFWTD